MPVTSSWQRRAAWAVASLGRGVAVAVAGEA